VTVVIAASGKNFVVLGADSRGIFGDVAGPMIIGMDKMKKLTVITRHVGALMYGAGELAESLLDEFRRNEKETLETIDGVLDVLKKFLPFCQTVWQNWFRNFSGKCPLIGFMIAGLDQDEKGEYASPRICSLESRINFAPQLHRYGFACQGLPHLSTYILNKQYRADMTVDELCTLVAYVISEVASTDSRVGGPISILVIDPTGAREISLSDVESMLTEENLKEVLKI